MSVIHFNDTGYKPTVLPYPPWIAVGAAYQDIGNGGLEGHFTNSKGALLMFC